MRYTYFASYFYTCERNSFGFGVAEFFAGCPITSLDHIIDAQEGLVREKGYESATIINYQLLREEEI